MKVIQDHKNCLGCGACVALCPKFWSMGDDGKAYPKNFVENSETGNYELEIGDNVDCNKEAAESCPVQAIKII